MHMKKVLNALLLPKDTVTIMLLIKLFRIGPVTGPIQLTEDL